MIVPPFRSVDVMKFDDNCWSMCPARCHSLAGLYQYIERGDAWSLYFDDSPVTKKINIT